MPIYEFQCNQCGKTFEQLVFSSDKEDRCTCPECGETDICKLMSCFACGSSSGTGADDLKGISSGCSPSGGGFS